MAVDLSGLPTVVLRLLGHAMSHEWVNNRLQDDERRLKRVGHTDMLVVDPDDRIKQ